MPHSSDYGQEGIGNQLPQNLAKRLSSLAKEIHNYIYLVGEGKGMFFQVTGFEAKIQNFDFGNEQVNFFIQRNAKTFRLLWRRPGGKERFLQELLFKA